MGDGGGEEEEKRGGVLLSLPLSLHTAHHGQRVVRVRYKYMYMRDHFPRCAWDPEWILWTWDLPLDKTPDGFVGMWMMIF